MLGWFKRKKPEAELSLATLTRGAFFEYKADSWQVRAIHDYTWEDESTSRELECHCGDQIIYLEMDEDEEESWLLSRRLPVAELDPLYLEMIRDKQQAPEKVRFQDRDYLLIEESPAYFRRDGAEQEEPLLSHDYEDASEEYALSIEQWGEREFTLSVGEYVDENRFSNLLPAPD